MWHFVEKQLFTSQLENLYSTSANYKKEEISIQKWLQDQLFN